MQKIIPRQLSTRLNTAVSAVPPNSLQRVTRPPRHDQNAYPHRSKACQHEGRRKPLPVYLAVNLVWRFIDAEGFQELGQRLVVKFPVPHLRDQHLLGPVLPRCVGHLWSKLQRSRDSLLGRFRFAYWVLAQGDGRRKKLQIGHIRPERHFSAGALPTRSHQQNF